VTAIVSKIEGVNVLLMAGKGVSDSTACDVPNSDQLVFRSSSKKSPVRAEANTTNVEISILIDGVVCKDCNLLSRVNVEYLRGAVASGGHILAVKAESHAAHHAIVDKVVNEIDVEHSWHLWIEHSEPILPFPL